MKTLRSLETWGIIRLKETDGDTMLPKTLTQGKSLLGSPSDLNTLPGSGVGGKGTGARAFQKCICEEEASVPALYEGQSVYTHRFIFILGLNRFIHLYISWGRYLRILKWGGGKNEGLLPIFSHASLLPQEKMLLPFYR